MVESFAASRWWWTRITPVRGRKQKEHDMSDWWSKKLAPASPPRYGLTVPPQPVQYPVYQQAQQPAQQPVQEERLPTDELTAGEAIRAWKGGDANRIGGDCPGCGSKTGYTKGYKQGKINGASARSHCFECGYNGEFEQADGLNWGVGV